MKNLKMTAMLIFGFVLLLSQTSCLVASSSNSSNNGKHKGWYKNPNNPHNPHTTNPGRTKGKSKGK